jgi:hypothetical protein
MTSVPAIRFAAFTSLALSMTLVALTPNSSCAEGAADLQLETLSLEANDPVYRIESGSSGTANSKPRAETTGEDTLAEHDVDVIAPASISDSGPTPYPVLSNPQIAD